MIHVDKVTVRKFMALIFAPVQTSFGIMHNRLDVFVQVVDRNGVFGWSEVWCNFSACGAHHWHQLVETDMAPLLVSRSFDGPACTSAWLTAATDVMAISQASAGLSRNASRVLTRHMGCS